MNWQAMCLRRPVWVSHTPGGRSTVASTETNFMLPCVVRCTFWRLWVRFRLVLTVISADGCCLLLIMRVHAFDWLRQLKVFGSCQNKRNLMKDPPRYTGRKRGNLKRGVKICREVWMDLNPCVNTAEINCVNYWGTGRFRNVLTFPTVPTHLCLRIWKYSSYDYGAGGQGVVTNVVSLCANFINIIFVC